ncbi:MAG: CPBP family intramembrane metalloprotease [Solobacterium sp.]|nr:CPBP family intramembrane metalloprotease [Solobacterium sp.]
MSEQDRINLYWFLGLTFFIGWALQFAGMYLLNSQIFRGMYLLSLTAPMIAVFMIFSGRIGTGTSGIGWGMKMRDKWMYLPIAWLAPAVFAVAGAVLFFLVFPGRFDPQLGALKELVLQAGEEAEDVYDLLQRQIFTMLTLGPATNAFYAMGAEVGWRGWLTPMLQRTYGRRMGLVYSGLVWAVWYMPLVIMAGFQYGHGYPGAPATGIVMMAVYCIAGGILLSWLYEKSGSILMAGIAHGAMMSVSSFGLYFLAHAPKHYLLGPGTGGVISVLPMVVCACILMKKDETDAKSRRRH